MLTQTEYEEVVGPGESTPAPTKRRAKRRQIDAASLGVAMLVALAGGGLFFMHWRTKAGVEMIDNAQASTTSLELMLAGGEKSITTLASSLKDTRAVVERFDARDDARLASAKPLTHDPFTFESLEPKALASAPADAGAASRDQARAAALEAARKLQLQSIIFGTARRACLIDGKLYFEGQTVGDFTVGRIAPDAVLLQSGEFKFELRLRK